jgi:hypothetical protein
MPACLIVSENQYALMESRDGQWAGLAVLNGGAAALLPSTRAVDEAGLEAAIEIAEDWLMPHARQMHGEVLEVNDATGRLKTGLDEVLSERRGEWSVEEFEGVFLQLLDMAMRGRVAPALEGRERFIADVLMLRELAHHGQVRAVRLV